MIDFSSIKDLLASPSKLDIDAIIAKPSITLEDFVALLNIDNDKDLASLLGKSQDLTLKRFGKTIGLYTPMYVSNKCHNICTYCGFSANNGIPRISLTIDEAVREASIINGFGIENLLIVSGEHKDVGSEYISALLERLRERFSFLSIETQPFAYPEYTRLVASGLNGVYIYQETYDRESYALYHKKGTKKDFDRRLEATEDICASGVYKMGLGFLLGLSDVRYDAVALAMHLRYLKKKYYAVKFGVSFPRLKAASQVDIGSFQYVGERELIKLIASFRLLEPSIDLVLSTRERDVIRDFAADFGVNVMSVASKTNPGGYEDTDSLEQFSIDDNRDVDSFKEMILKKGYYPVVRDSIF